MAYEKLIPKRSPNSGAARKNPNSDQASRKGSMAVVVKALERASQETDAVAQQLKSGEPNSTLARVQAIFQPVPVTRRRVHGLAELTDDMSKQLRRALSGDIKTKLTDEPGPLASFHTARRGNTGDNRDTLTIWPDFFSLNRPGQVYTLIHEATHAALPHVDIDVYSWTRLFTALQNAPEQLQNPDALAYFVRSMYLTEAAPRLAKPLAEQERDLGQAAPREADSVDPRLPEPERQRITLALAVAEAKVRKGIAATKPNDESERTLGPSRPTSKELARAADERAKELHAVLSAVEKTFFRHTINVNISGGAGISSPDTSDDATSNPLSSGGPGVSLPKEIGGVASNPLSRGRPQISLPREMLGAAPRGPYGRAVPRIPRDIYSLADVILRLMISAVAGRDGIPQLSSERIASDVNFLSIYFRRPSQGPMHIES